MEKNTHRPTWEEREREARELFAAARRQGVLAAIPPRYRGGFASLADAVGNHEAILRLEEWCEQYRPEATGWYISGPTGTGKTGAAYAIQAALLQSGHDAVLWYLPDLLHALRTAMDNAHGASQDDIITQASDCTCLLLDDLSAEQQTEWAVKTLSLVIDRRYRNCRTTIVTSNLSGNDMRREISGVDGQRILSRLNEMVTGIRLDGADVRLRNRQ